MMKFGGANKFFALHGKGNMKYDNVRVGIIRALIHCRQNFVRKIEGLESELDARVVAKIYRACQGCLKPQCLSKM